LLPFRSPAISPPGPVGYFSSVTIFVAVPAHGVDLTDQQMTPAVAADDELPFRREAVWR
jgi:hypothetical protein